MAEPTVRLLEALAVTAELTGAKVSPASARIFAADLAEFPEPQVLAALSRCRRELKHPLTLADVLERIDHADGRPGPDEAWGLCPLTEADSAVWTAEMSQAFFDVAQPLLDIGDKIAARMAFREAYARAVEQARADRVPVQWSVTLGLDPRKRADVVQRAVDRKRITAEHAKRLLPPPETSAAQLDALIVNAAKHAGLVEDKRDPPPPGTFERLRLITGGRK